MNSLLDRYLLQASSDYDSWYGTGLLPGTVEHSEANQHYQQYCKVQSFPFFPHGFSWCITICCHYQHWSGTSSFGGITFCWQPDVSVVGSSHRRVCIGRCSEGYVPYPSRRSCGSIGYVVHYEAVRSFHQAHFELQVWWWWWCRDQLWSPCFLITTKSLGTITLSQDLQTCQMRRRYHSPWRPLSASSRTWALMMAVWCQKQSQRPRISLLVWNAGHLKQMSFVE